jgi:exosortase H (IPTLxxWG-CTERM-specific)
MLRFFLIFLVVQMVLFGVELLNPVQRAVVIPWTEMLALVSAWLTQAFDAGVISHGIIIQDRVSGVGVSIEAGCNGIEASIILVAAIVAFPASWRMKLAGLAIGFFAVQAVNVLRIISLFYLLKWNQSWFEFAHIYLWQALIMLDVLVVWMLWVRYVTKRSFLLNRAPHAA